MKLHRSNIYNSKLLAFTNHKNGRMLYIMMPIDGIEYSVLDPFNSFPETRFISIADATLFIKDTLSGD